MARRNTQDDAVIESQTTESAAASNSNSSYHQMLIQAAKMPTAYRTGAPVKTPSVVTGNPVSTRDWTNPGIMTLAWIPTLGVATSATDPVNMAGQSIYSFVRHANSGARNYESPDLQIYTLALDSLYSLYYSIGRVIGILNLTTEENRYYPRTLVTALGFDYDDFVDNQPNILFQLANWRAKLRQYSLPAQMRIYKEHRDMSEAFFTDGETARAQMYVFVQDAYWSYEVVDTVKGLTARYPIEFKQSAMTASDIAGSPILTWSETKTMFNTLLDAFLTSSDVALISGDITKAYGEAGFVDLPLIDNNYVPPIIKDDAMLLSIMNADITPVDPASMRVNDVTLTTAGAKGGYLTCTPGFNNDRFVKYCADLPNTLPNGQLQPWMALVTDVSRYPIAYGNSGFINMVANNPSDEECVAAMRFRTWVEFITVGGNVGWSGFDAATTGATLRAKMTSAGYTGTLQVPTDAANYNITTCGTEVITRARVYTFNSGSINILGGNSYSESGLIGFNAFITPQYTTRAMTQTAASISNVEIANKLVEVLVTLANFDWHPRLYASVKMSANVPTGTNGTTGPCIDTQNMAPVGEVNIKQFNDALLYYRFFE